MIAPEKRSRRYLLIALSIIAVGVVVLWKITGTVEHDHKVALRHPHQRRERQTARAVANPGTRVGILVEFVPGGTIPNGGYAMDFKPPLESVPVWLTNANGSFDLDRKFGTMAVHLAEPGGSAIAVLRPVVPGRGNQPGGNQPNPAPPAPLRPNHTATFAVRGTVRLEDLPTLTRAFSGQTDFLGVYSDPPIVPGEDPAMCPIAPVGSADRITQRTLPVQSPNDVLLAIVDLGFDLANVRVSASGVKFNPALSYTATNGVGLAGSSPGDEHGNMCAYDATLVATHATLVDLRVGDPKDLRLSDAEEAYNFLYAKLTRDLTVKTQYQGLVVSNSWGLWSKDNNLPASARYFDNPNHPFTLAAKKLSAAGADIVFSAGDSADCPPTSSTEGTIWGANSLDEVISVAAVDMTKSRITYSSQGPGALANNKPDVSAYSEFTGTDDGDTDTGTSAAAAVVAGMVAAIRSQTGWGWDTKSPADLKQHLIEIADKSVMQGGSLVILTGWSRDFGYGVARPR